MDGSGPGQAGNSQGVPICSADCPQAAPRWHGGNAAGPPHPPPPLEDRRRPVKPTIWCVLRRPQRPRVDPTQLAILAWAHINSRVPCAEGHSFPSSAAMANRPLIHPSRTAEPRRSEYQPGPVCRATSFICPIAPAVRRRPDLIGWTVSQTHRCLGTRTWRK